MKYDLRACFLAVVLLSLAMALGGASLLRREYARSRVDMREDARELADALAKAMYRRHAAAGEGLPEKVDVLASDLSRTPALSTAFVWRKGKGVIWTKGDEQMILREMDGSFKWVAEGSRAKHPKRGFFTEAGATVAWARIGPKDVGGYVLAPCVEGSGPSPATKFALKACLIAVAAALLMAGGWYLWRAAARAREESDALVEMMRRNMESQEVDHVHV